jgi:hypothetical protein
MGSEYFVKVELPKELTIPLIVRIVQFILDKAGIFTTYNFEKTEVHTYSPEEVFTLIKDGKKCFQLNLDKLNCRIYFENYFDTGGPSIDFVLFKNEVSTEDPSTPGRRMILDKILIKIKEICEVKSIVEFLDDPKLQVPYVIGEDGFTGFWERYNS